MKNLLKLKDEHIIQLASYFFDFEKFVKTDHGKICIKNGGKIAQIDRKEKVIQLYNYNHSTHLINIWDDYFKIGINVYKQQYDFSSRNYEDAINYLNGVSEKL